MKKRFGFLLTLLLICVTVTALAGVPITDPDTFPDENFRAYLATLDKEGEGWVIPWNLTEMNCSGREIASLSGICNFFDLEKLDCSNNKLDTLFTENLEKLKSLNCSGNPMSSLDITKNAALQTLNISKTGITSLDVAKGSDLAKAAAAAPSAYGSGASLWKDPDSGCWIIANNGTVFREVGGEATEDPAEDPEEDPEGGETEAEEVITVGSEKVFSGNMKSEVRLDIGELFAVSSNPSVLKIEGINEVKRLYPPMSVRVIFLVAVKGVSPGTATISVYDGNYQTICHWTKTVKVEGQPEPPPALIYDVSVTTDGHGTASASPSSGAEGTEVALAATPDEGYQFKEWQVVSGGVSITNNKFTIGASNVEIKAIFEKAEVLPAIYSVSVIADGHGTASADPASGPEGTEVTLAATPDEGYQFKEWQVVSGGVTITDSKFIIGTSNVEIKAVFEKTEIPPPALIYDVTVTTDGYGTVSADPVSGPGGTEVTLAATPDEGYKFKEWVVISGSVAIENDRFTIGSSNVEIQAVFAALSKGDSFVSGGMKYQILTDKTVSFLGLEKAKSKTSVSIPATVKFGGKTYKVTEIAAKALYKDTKVKTVTIGKNVKTIGKNAVSGAKALTTVKGGSAVTGIGDSAFASCAKLKTFPALGSLKTIGANALKGCKALPKFTIGVLVEKIGKNAFNGCTNLKTWTVHSKKLTAKNVGAGAFKNISKKATFKCPSGKLAKSYETIFRKAGAPKTSQFTK